MRPAIALGLVAVVGYGAYRWYSMPKTGGKNVKIAPSVSKAIVLGAFNAKGFHTNTGKAAWTNCMAESAGDNLAVGDGGRSVGLYQINDLGGKRDLSGCDRTDPASATRWIMDKEASALRQVDTIARSGAPLGDVAAAFSRLVERPADVAGEQQRRAALATKLFPPGVS